MALTCGNAPRAAPGRVTTTAGVMGAVSASVARGGEVEEAGWLGELERGQDGLLPGGGGRALRDVSVGGGQGDQVHAVKFVADVAPGVVGGVLDHPQQQ